MGPRNVTVTTGQETASLANGFTVGAGTPVITLVNPDVGQQGQQNLSVVMPGLRPGIHEFAKQGTRGSPGQARG